MFSVGVKLSGLDDFVEPSQNCIKPAVSEKPRVVLGVTQKRGTIRVESDGTYKEMSSNGDEVMLSKAKITLNDCLACSGCVTTAETILIEQQSYTQILEALKARNTEDVFVASVSPQSVSSLAAFYQTDFVTVAEKISSCLKSLGVNYVFDCTIGRNLTLIESGKEFVRRFQNAPNNLPVFTSSCPGWICYAEKTHGDFILPYISKVKSPQQMMGSLVKRQLAEVLKVDADKFYHFTVMPCFDKKLEALRSDFVVPGTDIREVDCVVATNELFLLIAHNGTSLMEYPSVPFDHLTSILKGNEEGSYSFLSHEGSGSGGYVEHVFKYASGKLFGVSKPDMDFVVKRSSDHKELFLTVDGEVKLRFAVANGFKNLGNFAMKLKKNNLKYDYVEIMACPSGCLNGGGQLRAEGSNNKELLGLVTEKYLSLPKKPPQLDEDLNEQLNSRETEDLSSFLFTDYKGVPKMNTNSLNIKW